MNEGFIFFLDNFSKMIIRMSIHREYFSVGSKLTYLQRLILDVLCKIEEEEECA